MKYQIPFIALIHIYLKSFISIGYFKSKSHIKIYKWNSSLIIPKGNLAHIAPLIFVFLV